MTLVEMTYNVLKDNFKTKFTAKELAIKIVETYPSEFVKKRQNDRFSNENEFLSQVAAEIGRNKESLLKKKGIINDKQNRPQLYFFNKDYEEEIEMKIEIEAKNKELADNEESNISESDLYPILGSYLKSELNIYSRRIDERKSKNNRGPKGNIWLHPDVVGLELLDENWNTKVKQSIKGAGGNRVKLYSFEVKKKITQSSLREYFFQAVSNSSWANQGFLVAEELKASDLLFAELKMLSTLHGIGFILLNKENPSESQTLLPAREKIEPDWVSINRLVNENSDFEEFITSLKIYYDSGEINKKEWYK
jgi:hypothetical protein